METRIENDERTKLAMQRFYELSYPYIIEIEEITKSAPYKNVMLMNGNEIKLMYDGHARYIHSLHLKILAIKEDINKEYNVNLG